MNKENLKMVFMLAALAVISLSAGIYIGIAYSAARILEALGN